MSFKKRITKGISLALIGVIVGTPVLNTVSATGHQSNGSSMIQTVSLLGDNGENIILLKSVDNSYQARFNKDTGEVTHTYYNVDGSIKESYSVNYYENLKKYEKEKAQYDEQQSKLSGPVIYSNKTSWSPDMLQLQVKQVKKDGKTMHQCDMWNSKNNYKQEFRTKYTSSASIMAFDSAIQDTSNKWNYLVSIVGSSAAIAIASFIGTGSVVTTAAIAAALVQLGFDGLLNYLDSITGRWNDYSNAVRNGDHKYNAA